MRLGNSLQKVQIITADKTKNLAVCRVSRIRARRARNSGRDTRTRCERNGETVKTGVGAAVSQCLRWCFGTLMVAQHNSERQEKNTKRARERERKRSYRIFRKMRARTNEPRAADDQASVRAPQIRFNRSVRYSWVQFSGLDDKDDTRCGIGVAITMTMCVRKVCFVCVCLCVRWVLSRPQWAREHEYGTVKYWVLLWQFAASGAHLIPHYFNCRPCRIHNWNDCVVNHRCRHYRRRRSCLLKHSRDRIWPNICQHCEM